MANNLPLAVWFQKHRVLYLSLAAAAVYFVLEPMSGRFYYVFSPEGFIVLHSIMEAISIIIAFMSFGITFHSRKLAKNSQNLFLGVAFLCIGLIDVFHALSYDGMPSFITPNTVDKATQLWMLARLVGAAAFLAAAFIRPDRPGRILKPFPLLTAGLAIPVAVLYFVVIHPGHLPAMFVPGEGLTPLKINLEYAIVAAQTVAAMLFYRMYMKTHEDHLVYFIGAMVMGICSELFFTLYASPYDIYNFMGHAYKVAGYFFIYYMLFVTSIEKSYSELSNAKEVLSEYSEHLEDTVMERTKELADTNKELVRLVNMKNEFLAICSHDMRAPLQSSILLLDMLLDGSEGTLTPDQKQSLEAVKKNEYDQLALVVNILGLAVREQGGLRLNLVDVDVARLIEQWAPRHIFIAERKGIRFVTDVASAGVKWRLDEFKISQVLNNLASNALKFTPSGGEIRITADMGGEGSNLRVSVFNSGQAIRRDELSTIFERFHTSARRPSTKGHGSVGLGLNIAKTNVELHGGKIWAESEEGVGNTFTFTIPQGGSIRVEG